MINIRIKTPTGEIFDVDVEKNGTVLQLKEAIEAQDFVIVSSQKLKFLGKVLEDQKLLSEYKIIDNSRVYLSASNAMETLNETIFPVKMDPKDSLKNLAKYMEKMEPNQDFDCFEYGGIKRRVKMSVGSLRMKEDDIVKMIKKVPVSEMEAIEVVDLVEDEVENQVEQDNRAQSPIRVMNNLMLDDWNEDYEDQFHMEAPPHGGIIAEEPAVLQAVREAVELRDAATSPIFRDLPIRNQDPVYRLPDSDISFLVQTYHTDFRVHMRKTDPVSEIKKEYSRRYGTPESNLRCFVAGQTGEGYGGFTIEETGMIKQNSIVYMMEGPAYVRPPRYGQS